MQRAAGLPIRRWGWPIFAGTVALVVLAAPVGAFVEARFPLDVLIKTSDEIFLTKVDRLDPDRPSVVLAVGEALKGKASHERLAINLTGDKEQHTPQLLKRLAPDLPVLVCLKRQGQDKVMIFAYTNGTWFQVVGQIDGAKTRWAFTHCEVYLRRTFKGTTAELEQTIRDVVAGKRKAPAYDGKEPPGLGEEVGSLK